MWEVFVDGAPHSELRRVLPWLSIEVEGLRPEGSSPVWDKHQPSCPQTDPEDCVQALSHQQQELRAIAGLDLSSQPKSPQQ